MTETKYDELMRLRQSYPDFSPFVLLKLSMVLHGVKLNDNALAAVQSPYYAFGKAEPFGISFAGRSGALSMPGPILLRDGSTVYINYGEAYAAPYELDYCRERELFILKDGEREIDTVDFTPRPAFYGKHTSRGTPMEAVAEARAQKLILTCYQGCDFWRTGHQCSFCAFFSSGKTLGEVSAEDIRETVAEALKEPGRFSELYLSGGTDYSGEPSFSNEIERYIRVLQAIGDGFSSRFSSQLMAPAYPMEMLRRLYDETLITSYCPNIEVWDRELFRQLCPGKSRWIGREEWIRRTVEAVEVFGKGKVCTQIVAGAELASPHGFKDMERALDSNFEACEFFSKNGVIFLSTLWRPHKASRLGWQEVPPLEYYVRLSRGLHEIRRAYGLRSTNDDYKHCGNHPDSDLERRG